MRYLVLACDYDGTLASDGVVASATIAALEQARASGRKLLLVTGRELPDLRRSFDRLDLFDRVVAENGALVYRPAEDREIPLAPPPSQALVEALRARGVEPLGVGRTIISTRRPNESLVLDAIGELGLELQIIFNKGAVMVLPSTISKCTGLLTALRELGLSAHNTLSVGDGENDHAFLAASEAAVAVANAVPSLKEQVDWTTSGARGAGVEELIALLLKDDLRLLEPRLTRHHILLGADANYPQQRVTLRPYRTSMLVAGSVKSGKSSLTLGILERLADAGYQYCLIDPEGDYEAMPGAVNIGSERQPPTADEVLQVLARPDQSAVVSLLSLSGDDRPRYLSGLLPRLEHLRVTTGRPAWLVLDEAHHVLPASWGSVDEAVPRAFGGLVMITLRPRRMARAALELVDTVCAIGDAPRATIREFCEMVGAREPATPDISLDKGDAVVWARDEPQARHIHVEPSRGDRRRHRRKYALGELPPDRSFYFVGPDQRLHLRAYNLSRFLELADGVDDDTWSHHLRAGDYSRWVAQELKDRKLAQRLASIEADAGLPPRDSRARVRAVIEERYAPPE
jgi:hydroxymethylpyrimidine pyrophosphatase-like HAD family hydrolase